MDAHDSPREAADGQLRERIVENRNPGTGASDGQVEADGRIIYTGKDLRVGLFQTKQAGAD